MMQPGAFLAVLLLAAASGAALGADPSAALPAMPPPLSAVIPTGPVEAPVQRAQLRARRAAMLSAGLNGLLLKLPVREGEAVAEGAVIAVIDCAQQEANKRLAEAKASGARAKLRVSQRMTQLNQGSVLEQELARSEAAMAAAEIAAIEATLRKCTISAPFAGMITATHVRDNQYVREGDPLVEILDPADPEIEMVLPARWLPRLEIGQAFTFISDDVGSTHPAVVDRINAKVDPVSSTVRVLGRLLGQSQGLLPGMSGGVRFEMIDK